MEREAKVPPPPERSPVARIAGALLPRRGSALRLAFDVAFGLVAPPILFHLDLEWDPMGTGGIHALPLRPYAPLLAFGAMACLTAWLPGRRRAPWLGAFLAGPLLGGALLALCIGLWLAPLSFFAILVMGLGLLGLVPFLTALVFLDAGIEALGAGRLRLGKAPSLAAAACAGLLLASLAAGSGRLVKGVESRETAVLAEERPGDAERAVRRLRLLRRFPGIRLSALVAAARGAEGPRASRLSRAYERITGHPVPEID